MNRFHPTPHFNRRGTCSPRRKKAQTTRRDAPQSLPISDQSYNVELADSTQIAADVARKVACNGVVPLSAPLLSLSPSLIEPQSNVILVKLTTQIKDAAFRGPEGVFNRRRGGDGRLKAATGLRTGSHRGTEHREHDLRDSEARQVHTGLGDDGDGRHGAKTPGIENIIHRGASKSHSNLQSNVPLHSKEPIRTNTNAVGKSLAREIARPLEDKTPFPNRKFNTPVPDNQKLAKLVLEANKTNTLSSNPPDVPGSVARVSSSRAHARAPRLSANIDFVTPLNNGKHWDVSEGEVSVPEVVSPHLGSLELEDFDEIEYMPPKSVGKYTPPFDFELPHYSSVGLFFYLESSTQIEFNAETDDPFTTDASNNQRKTGKDSKPSQPPPSYSRSATLTSRSGTSSRSFQASDRHIKRLNPGTSTTTTVNSDALTPKARALTVRRPATAGAMYPSKASSKPLSKKPTQSRVAALDADDFSRTIFGDSLLEGDDFMFNV
ncbi:hypothetical protein C8R43DRAFT_959362 [Mycena crocata]|nr:hypothetical protein C8R43DRAFT_959362 [Mycena crocata]